MNLGIRARRLAAGLAATAILFTASPLVAQEVAESHLKAAREAISALKATEEFDMVLPQAAAMLKAELTQKNPNLVELITTTVDSKALELAPRRADLEREVAKIYAKIFTEAQLAEIAAFYNTETGKKLLSDGEIVGRETLQAATIWQRGIGRDLAQAVGAHIESVVGAQPQQPAEGEPAPAEQPAEGQ